MKSDAMRKTLVTAITLLMAVSLAACGSGGQSDAETPSQGTVQSSSPDKPQPSTEHSLDAKEAESSEEAASNGGDDAASSNPAEEQGESAADAKDGKDAKSDAGAISEASLSEGVISIDGEILGLGMSYGQIQDGGWAPTKEDYEKYQAYVLNPRTTSGNVMALYSDAYGQEYGSFHIMISVVNVSEQPIGYFEGAVNYLDIPGIARAETVPEVILPGGLTLESTEDQFRAAYGEPSSEYEDESTGFRSVSFQDGDVKLTVVWVKGSINEITLTK